MNKWYHPKRRFRQRDLLPKSLQLVWAQLDYGFAEMQLMTETGKPMTPENLVRHSSLLTIRELATNVLLEWNVPAALWGEMPPQVVFVLPFDDSECQGR